MLGFAIIIWEFSKTRQHFRNSYLEYDHGLYLIERYL